MNKKFSYAVIVIGATLLASIVLLAAVVYPLYKTASKTTVEANVKSEELAGLKKKKQVLDKLKSREEELKQAAKVVSSALPESKDVGSLFIQVNELASSSNGVVKSISGSSSATQASSTTSETGFEGIKKYTFTVPLSVPNYFSLKSFVNSSSTALRLLSIESASLSSPDGGTMESNLVITTFARN